MYNVKTIINIWKKLYYVQKQKKISTYNTEIPNRTITICGSYFEMYEEVFTIFISLFQIFSEYETNIEKIWNYQADVAERNDRFLEVNTL